MATKFIHRGADGGVARTGSHAGIGVDSDDNRLYFNPDGTRRALDATRIQVASGNLTLTAADSGKVIVATGTASQIISLPATAAGLTYTLVVGVLPSSGAGHAFSPVAADKFIGNGFTPLDDKDALCPVATDRVGDVLEIVGDGVDGWYITSLTGTWTRE